MKKLIVTLFLIVSILGVVYASPLEAEGVGNTLEEAHENALAYLSEMISVSVISETEIGIDASGDYLNSSVSSTSDNLLLGVTYSSWKDSKSKLWHEKAYIGVESIILYINSISDIFNDVFPIEEVRTFPDSDAEYMYLRDKVMSINKLDKLISVYMILADDWKLEGIPVDWNLYNQNSIKDLRARYMKILSSRWQESTLAVLKFERTEGRRGLSEDEIVKLDKARKEIDEYVLQQEDIRRQQNLELLRMKKELNDKERVYIDSLLKLEKQERVIGSDWREILVSIEDDRLAINEKIASLNSVIEQHNISFEKEKKELYATIVSAPYAKEDYDNQGNVIDVIKKDRNIRYEKKLKELEAQYRETVGNISLAVTSQIAEMISELESDYEELANKEFHVSSFVDEMYRSIDYSLEDEAWKGKAYLMFGNSPLEIPYQISYSEWTGKKSPVFGDYEASKLFFNEIEFWNNIFLSSDNAYQLDFSFKLIGDLSTGQYTMKLTDVRVLNPMSKDIIVCRGSVGLEISHLSFDDFISIKLNIDNDQLLTSEYVDSYFNWYSNEEIRVARENRETEERIRQQKHEEFEASPIYKLMGLYPGPYGSFSIVGTPNYTIMRLGLGICQAIYPRINDNSVFTCNLGVGFGDKMEYAPEGEEIPGKIMGYLEVGGEYVYVTRQKMIFTVGLDNLFDLDSRGAWELYATGGIGFEGMPGFIIELKMLLGLSVPYDLSSNELSFIGGASICPTYRF